MKVCLNYEQIKYLVNITYPMGPEIRDKVTHEFIRGLYGGRPEIDLTERESEQILKEVSEPSNIPSKVKLNMEIMEAINKSSPKFKGLQKREDDQIRVRKMPLPYANTQRDKRQVDIEQEIEEAVDHKDKEAERFYRDKLNRYLKGKALVIDQEKFKPRGKIKTRILETSGIDRPRNPKLFKKIKNKICRKNSEGKDLGSGVVSDRKGRHIKLS